MCYETRSYNYSESARETDMYLYLFFFSDNRSPYPFITSATSPLESFLKMTSVSFKVFFHSRKSLFHSPCRILRGSEASASGERKEVFSDTFRSRYISRNSARQILQDATRTRRNFANTCYSFVRRSVEIRHFQRFPEETVSCEEAFQ